MINVAEALQIIKRNVNVLPAEKRILSAVLGYVLAADVHSQIDMPPFNQSAMDGYALNFREDLGSYQVVGEVAAGNSTNPDINLGEGVRIFTGAMVPDDANVVVQQEWTNQDGDTVKITEPIKEGRNIRFKGEQIKKGTVALEKGRVISSAAIGFLYGLGIVEVEVYRKPKITLITTGNELVVPGNPLLPGQIYESNSYMIASALERFDFNNFEINTVEDDYVSTLATIESAVNESDLVILTGGISVGDYDFVGKALKELGTNELFYKINQKPGKPIYMGKIEETLIAALPGNPAAALTCFYMYVLPALNQMTGHGFEGLSQTTLPLKSNYTKKGSRAVFLKASINKGQVTILDGQSSAMLRTFAQADALVYLTEDADEINAGEMVTVYLLKD